MTSLTDKPQGLTDAIRSLLEAMAAQDERFVPHAKPVQETVGRMCEPVAARSVTSE